MNNEITDTSELNDREDGYADTHMTATKQDGTEYVGRLGHKDFRLIWYFAPSSRTAGWRDQNGKTVQPTHFLPKPADPHI